MLFSESQGGPVLLSSLPSARQSTGALSGGDKSAALCRVPRALPKAASRTTLDSPLVADSAPSRVPTFRFFKHILGCRHLISHDENGIEIQTYCAIIACLLISLWTGRKPTLRTYEMICYY